MGNLADQLPEHLDAIRAVVAKISRDVNLVDDLSQECCARVIEKEALWDKNRGSLRVWLHAIARNLTLDFLKKRKREKEAFIHFYEDAITPPKQISEEEIRWVLIQFRNLPQPLKEVLYLKYYENMNTVSIAKKLGVSQQAVSKRIQKAISILQRKASAAGLLPVLFPWNWGFKTKVVAGVLATIAATTYFFLPDPSTYLIADTRNLKNTVVTAHLAEPIVPGKNYIYCATFQVAWNKFKNLLNSNIHLENEPPLVPFLNQSSFSQYDLSDKDYVAGAGFAKDDIVSRIQQDLMAKFHQGKDPLIENIQLHPKDIFIYAFLYKNLQFETEFESLDEDLIFTEQHGRTSKVKAFGIEEFSDQKQRHQKLRNQVSILSHQSNKDFVIELKSKSVNDRLLLAKVQPSKTLGETVTQVMTLIKDKKPIYLESDDCLGIPKFDFDLTHHYQELLHKNLRVTGLEDYFIGEALQTITFKLNEKGAILKSRTTFIFSIKNVEIGKKRLLFDHPFLLLLIEKGAENPYLVLWIDNVELLVKAEKQ